MVSALYHPMLGGLGRQAQHLAERLRREGVDLFVIAREMDHVPPADFSPDVEVVRVPALFPREHILEEVTVRNVAISITFSLGCLRELVRRRSRYDLVHFHGASIPLFLSLPVLKRMGKKVVVKVASIQGSEAGSLSGRHGGLGNLLARMVREVDAFIAISDSIAGGLLRDGIPEGHIHRIPNFIDGGMFRPPDAGEKKALQSEFGFGHRTVAVFAGRLAPVKGIDTLLEAWSAVSPRFPGCLLLILGEGPMRDFLKEKASRLGIAGSVLFPGRVDGIERYYRASDLFVLSSKVEGLPNALLEAMATGLPVVATRVGGVPDVVRDGENGLLAVPGEPSSLARGIAALLGDETLRASLGAAAARDIRGSHSLDSIAKRYLALYGQLGGEGRW